MEKQARPDKDGRGLAILRNLLQKAAHSMGFKIVVIFFATFLTSGYLVYEIEKKAGNTQYETIWDGIWWGIVTITTSGYGDKIPVTGSGRFIAALTMCVGILCAGIVTGSVASWLVERQLKAGRGLVNLTGKSGHLLICGWRREMAKVLEEIFLLDPAMKPENIVIVAPIPQEVLDTFKADERFAKVNVLRGDYYTQAMLERAGVKQAKKVLILADWSGSVKSLTGIDANTVLTAMTINKIAPEVRVAAELLDLKFENYLKMAQCDEIIYSKEYSRILLANSAKSAGLAHIIFDLLDVSTAANIKTLPLPPELIGKTFADVAAYCKNLNKSIAIGLIENTGKVREMKKEALRAAQKNPNTRTVLTHLKEVRQLGSNVPVLNPKKDYKIKNYSMAVVISNKLLAGKQTIKAEAA